MANAISDRSPIDLGVEAGNRYMEATGQDPDYRDNVLIRMRPERWLSVDFAKAGRS